jgi:hypothetical protein
VFGNRKGLVEAGPVNRTLKWGLGAVLPVALFGVAIHNKRYVRAAPPPEGDNAVVVELFTSEGCSSCPPADKLLAEMEREQPFANAEVIALVEHVGYWNKLGWTDPFSSDSATVRQYAYVGVIGDGNAYTPQMVVDGQKEFVGSREQTARNVIERAGSRKKAEVSVSVAGTQLEQRVSLEDYSVSNRGLRSGLVGTAEQVAEKIAEFEAAGVDLLLLQFSPQLEEMEAFSKGVIREDTRDWVASGAVRR